MTNEEIIEMVEESALGFLLGDNWMLHHELEYFAKLVAEKAIAEYKADVKINQNSLWQKLTRGQE